MHKSVLGKINKLQENIFEKPKFIIHRFCLLGLSAFTLPQYRLSRFVWGGGHFLYKDTYTRFSDHGRDKQISFPLCDWIVYFPLQYYHWKGVFNLWYNLVPKHKRKMVDVIEKYTIWAFVLVSLSSFYSQFLFWDPSCRRSIITLYFFRV